MNLDLKQLIRLQSVDLSIQELRTRIDKFPGISKALDEKLRSAQTAVETAKDKAKSNQGTRKKLENDIGSIEAKISKYRDQMIAVKNNDEYRALQHEIDHAQQAIRKIEDEILNLMIEAETGQSDLKAAEAHLQEDQKRVIAERKQLEEENRRDLTALDGYLKERKEIDSSLSPEFRVWFALPNSCSFRSRDYVAQVRRCFLERRCVRSTFTPADEELAAQLYRSGLPVADAERAILLGSARKYVSWTNHGIGAPVTTLHYFRGVFHQLRTTPIPSSYWTHITYTIGQLEEQWDQSRFTRSPKRRRNNAPATTSYSLACLRSR